MVPVATERLNDVYALLSGGNATSQPSNGDEGGPPDDYGDVEEGQEPWDQTSLRRFYRESSSNMQTFLRSLAEQSPGTLTSTEAGKDLPKGAQSVAGMLGAAGRRAANRHGRGFPWAAWAQPTDDHGGSETVFKMPEGVAKVINTLA